MWPSGAELATSLIAIVPAPPGLFSTNTDCPSCLLSSCATLRDTTSELPPGANGTTKRIGLVGQLCAAAASGARLRVRLTANSGQGYEASGHGAACDVSMVRMRAGCESRPTCGAMRAAGSAPDRARRQGAAPRPGFAFDLRGQQLGRERREQQAARAERRADVQAGTTRHVVQLRTRQTRAACERGLFVGHCARVRLAVACRAAFAREHAAQLHRRRLARAAAAAARGSPGAHALRRAALLLRLRRSHRAAPRRRPARACQHPQAPLAIRARARQGRPGSRDRRSPAAAVAVHRAAARLARRGDHATGAVSASRPGATQRTVHPPLLLRRCARATQPRARQEPDAWMGEQVGAPCRAPRRCRPARTTSRRLRGNAPMRSAAAAASSQRTSAGGRPNSCNTRSACAATRSRPARTHRTTRQRPRCAASLRASA